MKKPEPNEMLVTLEDVVARLDALKVPYMVTGSFAMSTYATARTTMDIDIVIEIASVDVDAFEAKFRGDYYVDAASIRRAREHQSMFNMLSNSTLIKVDCIVRKNIKAEADKFGRRRLATLGGFQFWAITKEDLILSKLRWAKDSHSEMQFRDVGKLIESGMDESTIIGQVRQEGLEEVWKAFEEWKIRAAK